MAQISQLQKSLKRSRHLRLLAIIVCLLACLLVGCDSLTDCDCEDEIDDLLNLRGTPSTFDIQESAESNRHEYIYNNADGSQDTYVFEWGDVDSQGDPITVCCKRSVTRISEDGQETDITDDPVDDTDTDDEEETEPA